MGAKYGLTPWSTAGVNVVGSFTLGAIMAQNNSFSPRTKLLLGTGFCGAFTTFSTFSFDVVTFLVAGQYWKAFAYASSTNVLSIGAAMLGYKFCRRPR